MMSWRKGLAVLCVVAAALLLAATIVFVFDEDAAHVIFDYAADPGVMVVLGFVVLANVLDSLRIRRNGGSHLAQLPRDVITALVAMVNIRYLLQYMAKMDPDRDPVFASVGLPDIHCSGGAGLRGDFVVEGRWPGRA